MDNAIVTVDKNAINKFAVEGGKLVFKREAELELLKLLQLKDYIEQVIEEVKKNIAESGKKAYPDFKGVIGSKVKVITRVYGDKYAIVDNKAVSEQFIKTTTIYHVNADLVDSYLIEKGKLPEGIVEKAREEKVVISLKKE